MHIWTMVGDWLMQAKWLVTAPEFLEASSAVAGIMLAIMAWPRGCCKQDDLFSKKIL